MKKKRKKRVPKILKYIEQLSSEEILENEKELRRKARFYEWGGLFLGLICVLGILILLNYF